ncbi:hypothetical protein T492DRAFT_436230 [Pavlovales sp. CCMP2436]|nr:hypothetical protein T492DRAFT_436230 [Pavlovales sp. CCMP2436]
MLSGTNPVPPLFQINHCLAPPLLASKRRRHPPSAIGDTSVTGALTASTEQGRAKRDARTRPPNPFVHIAKVSAGPPPQVAGPTLRDVAKGHAKRELQASVLERRGERPSVGRELAGTSRPGPLRVHATERFALRMSYEWTPTLGTDLLTSGGLQSSLDLYLVFNKLNYQYPALRH